MSDSHQPEDIAANEKSLQALVRAIRLSQGQFSLILVRCNYVALRDRMVQRLRELSPIEIRELVLPASVKTLYTTIKAELGEEVPKALMVFGLESVRDLSTVLASTNHVREEFRKNFPFPLILWMNDQVLQQLLRVAPDFESWATTTEFAIATDELIETLNQSADYAFAKILSTGAGRFLDNAVLNIAIDSRDRSELKAALRDLQSRVQELDPELEANIEFLLGRDAQANDQMEEARQHYEQSLSFWQQKLETGACFQTSLLDLDPPQPPLRRGENSVKVPLFNPDLGGSPDLKTRPSRYLERYGGLLFYLGLWWRRYAVLHRAEYLQACRQARDYFRQCIEVFQQGNRLDLVAKFINPLGEVLTRLEEWNELEVVANASIDLYETYENSSQHLFAGYAYGLLAEVALQKAAWSEAKNYAELALQKNAKPEVITISSQDTEANWGWAWKQYQSLYLLLLAKSQQHLGHVKQALSNLEKAREYSNPQYDPQLYIDILGELRELYFQQGEYLKAFEIKQQRRLIEYQYNFQAFAGASLLVPKQQVINPSLAQTGQEASVSQEIAASGREHDVNRLIERISSTHHKLIVIHGESGVGKSSIIKAGLVPALKQQAIRERDALPILVRFYTNWVKELGRAIAEEIEEIRGIKLLEPLDSVQAILQQLRKNEEFNLLTVLIFDQFEEFFFVCTNKTERRYFFEFLQGCLNIGFVKVILSLREDYLHYLLECERFFNLDAISNNILDKNIRYYLGNFSPKEARAVIRSLTERSQFYLQPKLIDELVRDLASEIGEVRPIELQIVGAQLQAENITTLEQYRCLGDNPKAELVERYLAEVIKDCGSEENRKLAQLVLYLLTDENGTRPFKTRAELGTDLESAGLEAEANKLDLVLEILVGSGLVLLVPEFPAERYQLVHDYLVAFIRQQQGSELLEELKKEKEQRRLSEQKLNRFLKRTLIGSVAATVMLAISTISAAIFAVQSKDNEIAALSKSTEALHVSKKESFDTLMEGLRAGIKLKQAVWVNANTRDLAENALQLAVYGVREHRFSEKHKVYSVSFSHDGKTIVSGNEDGTVKLWNLEGKELKTLVGHRAVVTSVSFSPDGKTIASASGGLDRTIKLWNLEGKEIKTLTGHGAPVTSVTFSSDGKTIASGSRDGTVKLWNLEGKQLKTLTGLGADLTRVSFSSDGKTIAAGSRDGTGTVKLWNLEGKEIKTLTGLGAEVNRISFSSDGKTIAAGSRDGTVKLWSLEGKQLKTFTGLGAEVSSVSFSPDGKTIAAGSRDGTVKLWNLEGKEIKILAGLEAEVSSISFSSDGKTIAAGSLDKTIKLWNLEGKQLKILIRLGAEVSSVSFSPDSKTIASGSWDRTVTLWNLEGKKLKTFPRLGDVVSNVTFSPDGKTIAAGSWDKTVTLWNLEGKKLKTFPRLGVKVTSVSFNPDGKTIAAGSWDGTVTLWNLEGKKLKTFPGHRAEDISLSFSPNGKTMASWSWDGTVTLWNLEGKELKTFPGHRAEVTSVSFSPNGKTMASGSRDGTVTLWNLQGKKLKTLPGHSAEVTSLSFSPNGKTMASGSRDGTVILWDVNLISFDDFLAHACDWVHSYLANKPEGHSDKHLCDGIETHN